MAGRIVTAALMIAAGSLTLVLQSARATFELLLSIGAGTGLLYLLRWFWWRINAWSEIAAMASSFLLAVVVLVLQRQGLLRLLAGHPRDHRRADDRRLAGSDMVDPADRSRDAAPLLSAGAAGRAGMDGGAGRMR